MTMILGLLTTAFASDVNKTPKTFDENPGLTSGTVENFRELYIDPTTVGSTLSPSAAAEGQGALAIRNDYMSWSEVTIGDVKVGVLGPLTDGTITGVVAGTYDVALTYPNGHVWTGKIATDGNKVVEVPAEPAKKKAPTAATSGEGESESEQDEETKSSPGIKAATSGE